MLASASIADLHDGRAGGGSDSEDGATASILRVPPAIPEAATDDGASGSSPASSASSEYSPFSETHAVNPLIKQRSVSMKSKMTARIDKQVKGLRAINLGPKCNVVLPVVLSATLTGSFTFGYNISVLNTALDIIAADLGWCADSTGISGCDRARLFKSLLSVGLLIGAFFGALASTALLKHGCPQVLTMNGVISLIAIYFSSSAFSFAVLMGARVLLGFSVGVVSVVTPTFVAEISPPLKRGVYGTLHQLVITLAVTVGIAMGFPFTHVPADSSPEAATWTLPEFDRMWWRVLLGLSAVPVIGSLLVHGLIFNFDTPYYHLKRDEARTAEIVLSALRNNSTSDEVQVELSYIRATLQSASGSMSLARALQKRKYSRIILLGVMISLGQQLVGINAFITGSNTLYESVGLSPKFVTGMSVLMAGLQFVFSFPPLFMMDRFGRRPILLIGILAMCISVAPGVVALWVAPDAVYTTWLAIAGSLAFIIAFALSYGPICWVYLFEMFPANLREAGSGVSTAANWFGAVVMSFMAIYVATKVNYLIFFAMQVIWLILLSVFMKETKGRTLGDSPYLP
eukprot:Lankesteria_metandrocarpae@DN4918_c0_g1_i1.p1